MQGNRAAVGRSSSVFRQGDQVRLHRQDLRDPVPAGDSQLKVSPERRHLSQRIIKVVDIHKKADQEARGELPDSYKIDAIGQHDQLSHACKEPEHGSIYLVGDACPDRGGIVVLIGLRKTLPEIVAAIKSQHHLEIPKAFLDLGAHRPGAFQVGGVLFLYPWGNKLRKDPHQQRRRQCRQSQPPVDDDQENSGAGYNKKTGDKLHQGLGKELVDLVCVVVDT